MIRRFFCAILAAALFQAAAFAEPELVRLHVIAQNDTQEAQETKLAVRDAVLREAEELLRDAEDADEAYRIAEDNLERFTSAANQCLENLGAPYCAEAKIGVYWFPTRVYGETVVPAGEYRALRIELGEAEGRNWWCVLYPSLCRLSAGTTVDDIGGAAFYSTIGEWFRNIFFGREGA